MSFLLRWIVVGIVVCSIQLGSATGKNMLISDRGGTFSIIHANYFFLGTGVCSAIAAIGTFCNDYFYKHNENFWVKVASLSSLISSLYGLVLMSVLNYKFGNYISTINSS